MASPTINELRAGDTSKSAPYTIALVANPALEAPWNSGAFVSDPITANQAAFDDACDYIVRSLFGLLPGQAEALLADPSIGPNVRVVSFFHDGLPATDANSLVAQDAVSSLLVARRDKFLPFLGPHNISPDVAYAVSASATHSRASAWFTTDDPARGGTGFTLDGAARTHWHFCAIPGTVAIHATATSLTALHEFGHAASSYSDGMVVDQYVDGHTGVNNKKARPIPVAYGTLDTSAYASDPARDGLGYPATWTSYHCEPNNPAVPSLMDDYWKAAAPRTPESCVFDKITRQFLRDRLLAKLGR